MPSCHSDSRVPLKIAWLARPPDTACNMQETADNKLVVLHDLDHVLKVSASESVNVDAIAAIRQQGVALERATVKVRLVRHLTGDINCLISSKPLHGIDAVTITWDNGVSLTRSAQAEAVGDALSHGGERLGRLLLELIMLKTAHCTLIVSACLPCSGLLLIKQLISPVRCLDAPESSTKLSHCWSSFMSGPCILLESVAILRMELDGSRWI